MVVIAELAASAVPAFDAYERRVLALLARHDGRLERRLRTADARTELHVVSFADREGYLAYLADPDRQALRPLLAGVEVTQRVLEVGDVPD